MDLDSPDAVRQMQEQKEFARVHLEGICEGEAILLTTKRERIYEQKQCHAKEAVAVVAEDDVPETLLKALLPLICREDLYLFSRSSQSAQLAVRLGVRAEGSSVNEVHAAAVGENGKLTVKRMMYANHMEAVCEYEKPPFFLAMTGGCDRAELSDQPFRITEEYYTASAAAHILSEILIPETPDRGFLDSEVVIAGGRGIGGSAGMECLRRFAQAAGGSVGASRPAVMNAWAPVEELLGVSGSQVHPQICIVAGTSGAAAFYAGIEKSKWITAINKDAAAPIMKMADVAVQEDYEPFLKALEARIRKEREEQGE